MSLIDLYTRATENSYVGRVRLQQAGITQNGGDNNNLTDGTNFFDGTARTRVPTADQFQTELTRNRPGALKYDASGQNGQTPGSSRSVTGLGGLSRWTANALNIGFKDAQVRPGKTSIHNRFKVFKGNDRWNGKTNFHLYNPVEADKQFNKVLSTQFQKDRATAGTPSPSPAGLQG